MGSIDLFEDFNEDLDAQAGDEDDDDNRNTSQAGGDNIDGDNENKETIDAKIKVVRVKRKIATLNAERLKGSRGVIAVDDYFKDIKFKNKGYEKQDLDEVMKRLEHWAHRMFPKYAFDDSLASIERLGKKKDVAVYMSRYRRNDLVVAEERILSEDEADNRNEESHLNDEPMDEFEAILDEQIALTRTNIDKSFGNLSSVCETSKTTPTSIHVNDQNESLGGISNVSQLLESASSPLQVEITQEVRERIAANRLKAMAILQKKKEKAFI